MSIRIISLVLAGLMLGTAGCGGDSGGDAPAAPPAPGPLSLSVPALFVDYYDEGGQFEISNTGSASFAWTVSSNRTWLRFSEVAGDLEAGQELAVTITVDRDGLASGTHTAQVTVATDASDNGVVTVSVRNYDEDIVIVDFTVVDAEYNENLDAWVVVSSDPPRLHVIDAVEKTVGSVSLSIAPQCVSIRPDGAFAVVGHNAWITRVNLGTLVAESPVQVTTDANDVVLAQNDFAYVFPRGSGWDNVRSVELPAGNETQDPQLIYPGMIARLHPSGNSIYAADNGISPSDVEKFDISSGAAVYEYDSAYHGDYAFSGDLWLSADGSKFLSRSGNVFNTGTSQQNDMVYAGAISGVDLVAWAAQSPVSGKWYVCETSWLDEYSDVIRVYDGAFFQYESSLTVPSVPNYSQGFEDQYSTVQARFCAVNSNGTALHVIARRGDAEVWTVASIDLTQAP